MSTATDEEWWLGCALPDLPEELDEPPWLARYDCSDSLESGSDSLRAAGLVDLSRLARSGFLALPPAGRVDALVAIEKHRAWLDGLAQVALGSIADADAADHRAVSGTDTVARRSEFWCQEEVAAALRLAPVTAGSQLHDAQRLCHHLPITLDALLDGRIWGSQARAIVAASSELTEDLLPALENAILRRAEDRTLSQTKRALRRAVLRLDPSTAARAEKRARADRDVTVRPGMDGMADLVADLTAADALAIDALLDAAATQQLLLDREAMTPDGAGPADSPSGYEMRTTGQAKADILVDLILGALDPDHLPRQHGRRPVINVHVGLSTLTGIDNAPGWLDGYGPISADAARDIASDTTGTWRRLITDPATQKLLAYDIASYRPPAAITEHVVLSHVTCTFPGCARAARRCDIDHATAYSAGGSTTPANLHPLCRRHHRLKHEAGWRVSLTSDGIRWTSPQGRRYLVPPRSRLTEPGHDLSDDPDLCNGAGNADPPPF